MNRDVTFRKDAAEKSDLSVGGGTGRRLGGIRGDRQREGGGRLRKSQIMGIKMFFVTLEVELWTFPQCTKEQFGSDVRKSFETLGGVEKVELCGPWMVHV